MSFRGDGDVMVDALIKASEEQKCASAEPLPGAGRDLVPFDFDAHNTNDDHNKNNSSTPLLVGVDPRLRAHQVCAPQVPTGGHAAAAAKLSNSAPLEKNGHHTKGNNSNPNKGKNKNNSNNMNGHEPKYAGASFANSPDPDVVPLPSFLKTMPGAQATMAKRKHPSQNSSSSLAGSSPPTTSNADNVMQNLLSRSPPSQQQRPPMTGKALLGSMLGGDIPTPPQHNYQQQPPTTPSILNDLFGSNKKGTNGGAQLQPYKGPEGLQQYPDIPEPVNHDFQMMMSKLSNSHR